MSTPLLHARHNKEACLHLDQANQFPDWVVTTAFYCSMHYVNAVIFPYDENGKVYSTFEEYYNVINRGNKHTKHGLTATLVTRNLFSISAKYKLLKDMAHSARYHDYEVDQKVVAKVKESMESIEKFCEMKCSEKLKSSDGGPASDLTDDV